MFFLDGRWFLCILLDIMSNIGRFTLPLDSKNPAEAGLGDEARIRGLVGPQAQA